jgi:hypothetical protein
MSCISRLASGVSLGVFAMMAGQAQAQEAAKTDSGPVFTFEGKIGAEYNSNVAVRDLDTSTGRGDWAAAINGLLEVSGKPFDKLTLRGGYEFSQTLHNEFTAFNLTLHRGYAEAAYDFDLFTAGVLGNMAQANLDGEEYLIFSQISPYVSRQFGDKLFVRLAYAKTDKSFNGRPQRDADADTVSGDAYIFLDGTKRYIVIGGKALQEDANDDSFSFDGGSGRLRYVQRFDAMDREMTLRAGVEYEKRDYKAPVAPINVPREDKRTSVDVSLDAPIDDHLFVEASYRYGGYQSNLATADYDEHVGAVKLGVKY